jgi:hypothetical protein
LARSVDSFAAEIATELGFEVFAYPADWKRRDKPQLPGKHIAKLVRNPLSWSLRR